MNKNYQQSLEFINKSLQECPKALTLDIRMLKLNKLIIELISEKSLYRISKFTKEL